MVDYSSDEEDLNFHDVMFPHDVEDGERVEHESENNGHIHACVEDVPTIEDAEGNFSVSFSNASELSNFSKKKATQFEDFEILRLVGKGGYGKVHQVRKKDSNEIYAMKVLRKEFLIRTNNVTYTMTERNIMRNVHHPFIASLLYAFQTHGKVYLVMEFLNGGQLLYHMRKQPIFLEDHVKIYAAELVLAIEYLHSQNIIHRDIKPENILLSRDGHLCLADFGLAKVNVTDNTSKTFCGTMEYMAPEIIKGEGHGKAVDWWSLGILIFDLLTGSPPFKAKQKNTLQKMIISGKFKMPHYMSSISHSVIKSLLNTNPEKRLGSEGASQVKQHKFFSGINWHRLYEKEIPAPLSPNVNHSDISYFDEKYTKAKIGDSPVVDAPILTASQENSFLGFSFCRSFDEHIPKTFGGVDIGN